MYVKNVAFGNKEEAYVESRFTEGFNIVHSKKDNNKGKTLVMQALLYALGNDPIWPEGFKAKDYLFLCTLVTDDGEYTILRKNNDLFTVLHDGSLHVMDSIGEFKYYLHGNIFYIPEIRFKTRRNHIVYPFLFYQMFFVGQDERKPSHLIVSKQYSKNEFYEVLYALKGIESGNEGDEYAEICQKLLSLKEERDRLFKQSKDLKSGKSAITQMYSYSDEVEFAKKTERMTQVSNDITSLKRARTRAFHKAIRKEELIKELRSLNKVLEEGEIRCADCGSNRITYSTKENSITFDILMDDVKKDLLKSLQDQVALCEEEVERINGDIHRLQKELNKLVEEDDVTLEALLAFKNHNDLTKIDLDLTVKNEEIKQLESHKAELEEAMENQRSAKKDLVKSIVDQMNKFSKTVNPDFHKFYQDIFTKQGETYSGSSSTEFYLAKLYSLAKVFGHCFPIVMDGFREHELTSDKEAKAIELFMELPNQKIFTSTLKSEEGNKYAGIEGVNAIDYDPNNTYHILDVKSVPLFEELLKGLKVQLS